jgi:methylenetetrahydrofolate reductase (NADPH)
VDSAKSEDQVLGWGPRGGYVFQKSYVEFFVTEEEVQRLEKRLKEKGDNVISMYAANRKVSSSVRSS